jgi:hypothetical protein
MADHTTVFSGPLLPPPGEAPSLRPEMTSADCVKLWMDVMETCDAFLRGGLRREVGPAGDVVEAYREWYRERMEEHDQTVRRMLERMDRSWRDDDSQRGG